MKMEESPPPPPKKKKKKCYKTLWEKEKIVCYEKFFLLTLCIQKTCDTGT